MTPHELYRGLAKNPKAREKVYRGLFDSQIDDKTLEEIRPATNKAGVLDYDRVKDKMERILNR